MNPARSCLGKTVQAETPGKVLRSLEGVQMGVLKNGEKTRVTEDDSLWKDASVGCMGTNPSETGGGGPAGR